MPWPVPRVLLTRDATASHLPSFRLNASPRLSHPSGPRATAGPLPRRARRRRIPVLPSPGIRPNWRQAVIVPDAAYVLPTPAGPSLHPRSHTADCESSRIAAAEDPSSRVPICPSGRAGSESIHRHLPVVSSHVPTRTQKRAPIRPFDNIARDDAGKVPKGARFGTGRAPEARRSGSPAAAQRTPRVSLLLRNRRDAQRRHVNDRQLLHVTRR